MSLPRFSRINKIEGVKQSLSSFLTLLHTLYPHANDVYFKNFETVFTFMLEDLQRLSNNTDPKFEEYLNRIIEGLNIKTELQGILDDLGERLSENAQAVYDLDDIVGLFYRDQLLNLALSGDPFREQYADYYFSGLIDYIFNTYLYLTFVSNPYNYKDYMENIIDNIFYKTAYRMGSGNAELDTITEEIGGYFFVNGLSYANYLQSQFPDAWQRLNDEYRETVKVIFNLTEVEPV